MEHNSKQAENSLLIKRIENKNIACDSKTLLQYHLGQQIPIWDRQILSQK